MIALNDVPEHAMYSTDDCLEDTAEEAVSYYLDGCEDGPQSSVTVYGCELITADDCDLPREADDWGEALNEALCTMQFEWYGSRVRPSSREEAIEWMTSNIYTIAREYEVMVDRQLCVDLFLDGGAWWDEWREK